MGKLLGLKPAPAARAALLDELGDVRARLAAFAALGVAKREKQLSDEIATWYEGRDTEAEYVERGARYQLTVSACRNVTAINIRAAYKALGVGKFLAACSITLKALAEHLTEEQVGALSTTARTGSRALALTPIGAPVAARAAEVQ